MAQHKGAPKYGGRAKGTGNKITYKLREKITAFLSDKWPSVSKDFDKLSPRDRLAFYEKMLQFGLPKLESIQISELGFENLSDTQLDELITRLKREYGKIGKD